MDPVLSNCNQLAHHAERPSPWGGPSRMPTVQAGKPEPLAEAYLPDLAGAEVVVFSRTECVPVVRT
jgi:hypothetical protein